MRNQKKTTRHRGGALFVAVLLSVVAPVLPGRAAPSPADAAWDWPLDGTPPVLRPFDRPPERWMAGHRGVDLGASAGSPVASPADGVVVFVGKVVDRPVITIDHGDGHLSSFEPVTALLAEGTVVSAGDAVGHLSSEPHCPRACVHWGVREHGEYVNPLNFVTDRRPSILLPMTTPG
ncbi:murein DD-endopeptidase MepM/ murein hydrolase activator NlpD [Arthrobacter pigmenti]|uniref:Murein DD-endopeptidase MepM/ murein hydrolase activator NlpD n=1 Tax=Arthrobacter pigmenti TaxID=271432 RepID=A0A846RP02_9MICC|nr:murein DD-endopeptidase MepM/ murein hydrolase activator NlpD [Arthrobacter pigmenti]